MENRENQNPATGSESDISKSQSQQQPTSQGNQQSGQSGQSSDSGRGAEQTGDQAATGQSQSGQFDQSTNQDRSGQSGQFDQSGQSGSQSDSSQSGFGETATQQRSDVEGSSLGAEPTGESESGFVGSEGQRDTSSELVEDEDQDFSKDGQGAPEGK